MRQRFDAVIVGAGAAGLFCAGVAAQRGLRVALIDHAPRLAEKIRISGGGRCNFTNVDADRPERFLSEDTGFARHALRAYGPKRFVRLLETHRIAWHEKHRGQLFCDDSSERVVEMLRAECDRGGVTWLRPCAVHEVLRPDVPADADERFVLHTDAGELGCRALVVATGGLSIPKIGATDWGHRLAARFGLRVVEPRPALVPLTFTAQSWQPFAELSGLALEVGISVPGVAGASRFVEDLLFTHRGLSGPGVLQVSSFWRPGEPLSIDLAPNGSIAEALLAAREGTRQQLGTALAAIVPRRLAQAWLEDAAAGGPPPDRRLAELGNKALAAIAARFHDWRVLPAGTEGWRKAEVTAGGVATDELEPRTLEARRVPGLHFVGEVVDVTGWLGGYNFQWAWASGWCAAHALQARPAGA
ncbi:MAG: NAD(P)/FAD-dependent oxidoreductase [Burkholderiales bacterium]|nr:MAG: NAD(P)/FAD-dependent oxidoreductase [Burkholderiales bacterium]